MRAGRIAISACAALLLALPGLAQEPEESCVGKVRLRGPLWDATSFALEPGLAVVLDTAAQTIREACGTKLVIIEAHAYDLPTPELNQKLAELRAALVRHELVKRGVPAWQLLPAPYGDTRPMFPLDGEDAVERNRRITFRVAE